MIEKKKLPEMVIDEIRLRLQTGRLKLGEKLPNQNELSTELGVSRTSLREAMRMLDLLGIIEQRPGYGTVFRAEIPELHSLRTNLTLLSDSDATYELLEAREIIECGAVRLAAINITDSQVDKLNKLVEDMELNLKKKDYENYRKLDYNFHELINIASGNRFLNESHNRLKHYVQQYINENTKLLPGLLKESHKRHKLVCEAITSHDPDKAEIEMRQHIRISASSYRRYQSSSTIKNKIVS